MDYHSEPYSKVKKFYDLDQTNYEYERIIPLVDILLDQLKEKFCKKRE